MGYLCLPLNYPDKSIKIVGNIRSALVQAFFKMQAAFPEDKMVESVSQQMKDSLLFKRYYLLRGEVTKAAKKYLSACRPLTRKTDTGKLTKFEKMNSNRLKNNSLVFWNPPGTKN